MRFSRSYLRAFTTSFATLPLSNHSNPHAQFELANRVTRPDLVGWSVGTYIEKILRTALLMTLTIFMQFVPSSTAQTSGAGPMVTQGAHSVRLSFVPSTSPNVVGYKVYRSITKGGPYVEITHKILAPNDAFIDNVPVPHTTNYYVMTAVNSGQEESGTSKEVTAVVP